MRTVIRALAQRPVLAAVLGALTIAFSAIFVELADVTPATAAIFRCAYALPPLALLGWLEQRRYGPRARGQARLAWIAGAFFAADLVLWHHAIEQVGAGLATVLGNTQVVLVAVAAWALLGERPPRTAFAAIPVVGLGVLLISGVLEEGAYGANPALGVLFGVLTGAAYTAFLLTLREGNRDQRRPAGPLFDATLAAALGCALYGALAGDLDPTPTLGATAWLILLALSAQVFGWLLISISLPRLPAALSSVMLTFQPLCAVVFAAILVDEEPSRLQLAGAACILAGLIVATLTPRAAPVAQPMQS
jgi:drug/metabolite transporter (DMT)-like permease